MVKAWKDLKVLLGGCGSIGRRHARILHGLGLRDLWVCDPLPAQVEALRQETPVRAFASYEEGLLSRPDAVFVCTPPKLHLPMAHAALAAGAHVFCEKPLSFASAGIDELVAAARTAGRSVMVGLGFRYHAGLLRAKALLDSGDFGRLVSIRCLMGEHLPSVRPDYRTLFTSKYGGAFDLTHEVDLAAWYAGRPHRRVVCLAGGYSEIGIEAPDLAEILIAFDGPCLAGIHLDFFQRPRRRQTELITTRGVITVEFSSWDRCTVSSYLGEGPWRHEPMATARDDMFRDEDRSFLTAIAEGRPVDCGIEEARKSVEIVEQAIAAAGLPPIANL